MEVIRPAVMVRRLLAAALVASALVIPASAFADAINPDVISKAAGTQATKQPDGVVKIGWARKDVKVTVDGMPLAPAAGLGSWAAFTPMKDMAMVMGDTVVFQDEVDAAMDAAFAHGLEVTGLHNHFFYDTPKVYFMHIGGDGAPDKLAEGVKAVWDAIRNVRAARPRPVDGFGAQAPSPGTINANGLAQIIGHPLPVTDGIPKVTIGTEGTMHGQKIGASMGLTTWAAFSGSDSLAAIDGDFIMRADEIKGVLMALRAAGIHVVALHNHMADSSPNFYFTHFWGTGKATDLAKGFRAALDAQATHQKM